MTQQTHKGPRIVRCIACMERFTEHTYPHHQAKDAEGKHSCRMASALNKAGWKQDKFGVWTEVPK